jgi:hypothetical protein
MRRLLFGAAVMMGAFGGHPASPIGMPSADATLVEDILERPPDPENTL